MRSVRKVYLGNGLNSIPISHSAIENKGVVVGVNPETSEKVVEKRIEKENENDSDDAYLVDELTAVFRKSDPFGQAAYPHGAIEGWLILFVVISFW